MDKTKLEPVIKLQKLPLHVCDLCKQVFRNWSDLTEHSCHHSTQFYKHAVSAYVAVEKMKIHKYDDNSTETNAQTDYLIHKIEDFQAKVRKRNAVDETVTNGHILKPYKCPDCDIKFAAQSTLDLHSIVHMPYPHVCQCGIGYYKEKDLKSHIKLVHTNNKTMKDIKDKLVLEEKDKSFKNNVKFKCNKYGGILKNIGIIQTNVNT